MKEYLQRDHRVRSGLLRYTSKKPDRVGEERGRERWTLVKHDDGRRSLLAHSEIDDRPSVLRFVQLNLHPDWRPADAFVRITVGDAFHGSGWFRFDDGFAECETLTAPDGRMSQRMDLTSAASFFGGHAIQNDGWATQLVDRGRPGEIQPVTAVLSSPDHRGATGPMLARVDANMVFDGEERIRIEAGEFDAWHYRFVSVTGMAGEHPDYDIWTTTDGDFIFLKGEVGGYMQTYYELADLRDAF
ncbi:MAG: hypothetical protein QNJ73_13245 [Gammaproteobacteria bacterium]|nr:hypothetical protein [Gammaproteobacteria bacterium]